MEREKVEQAVRGIIAEIIEKEPDQIDADAHLVDDLGMDSMMALEILAAVEKRFRIEIPEEELPNLSTLNKAVAVAAKYVK